MVACKHCSTPNSLDSTFCKRCGTALPEQDVLLAQEKLTALIAEGNTAFSEGRTDEAMAVAEAALLSNPSSTAALSLKSLCHERRGELAEALECADLIVDLNPDSELDKIKRNQLRTKLSVSVQLATQPPDRRTAVIGSVAAVVLVICVGIGASRFVTNNESAKLGPIVARNETASQPSVPTAPQTATTTAPPTQQPTTAPQQSESRTQAPTQPQTRPNFGLSAPVTGELPDADPNADTTYELKGPVGVMKPPAGVGENAQQQPASGANTGSVKSPTPLASNDKAATGDDPNPKPDDPHTTSAQNADPGFVEIKISGAPRKQLGGGVESSGSTAGGARAMNSIGIQRFQLGNYSAAASSFEQALHAGGDQVSLNQWLARCYDNLGRKSDEIDAYKRCVAACQSALSSGAGNKDHVKSVLDTCQQELKVLQGN